MSARYLQLHIGPELAGADVNSLLRRRLGLSGTVLRRIKWLPDGITVDGVRVTVRCRVQPGQTLTQIAADRGVNKSTVCRTLKRAEDKLRRYLKY